MELEQMENDNLNNWLGSLGFLFPTSEIELDRFNKLYKNYEFTLTGDEIDPLDIINQNFGSEVKRKLDLPFNKKPEKIRAFDYYKRTLLAAEIVYQLKDERTLGHVKLQKLVYLCQQTTKMSIPTSFLKQAMGPYDPRMMRSIDKQLELKKWFKYEKNNDFKYIPLDNLGDHKKDFEKYLKKESETIQYIIDSLRKSRTNFVEIVGTLFACLVDIKIKKEFLSEELILNKFYTWSDHKKKYKEEEIQEAFNWMKDKGIVPK